MEDQRRSEKHQECSVRLQRTWNFSVEFPPARRPRVGSLGNVSRPGFAGSGQAEGIRIKVASGLKGGWPSG